MQKVDVDRVREIAARYQVSAMPTFICIKGGKKVAEVGVALGQAARSAH